MKRYLFILGTFLVFAVCFSISAKAQPRTEQEAEQIGATFLKELRTENAVSQSRLVPVRRNQIESALKVRGLRAYSNPDATSQQPFYIFNDEGLGGFVIVGGDERFHDILGYSTSGKFTPDDIPVALSELLYDFSQQYQSISRSNNFSASRKEERQWQVVEPLCPSQWNQYAPYNNYAPVIGGEATPTGCVATAMAQVMYCFKYPAQPQGNIKYTSKTNAIEIEHNLGNDVFQWNQMLDQYYTNQYTSAQGNAVAQLMRDCGYSVYMDYGTDGSSATMTSATYALIHNFGYNRNVTTCTRKFYSDDVWEQIIHRELEEGRPILYDGRKPDGDGGGHAFVLDGADQNGLLHFNWGWGGHYDGYFRYDPLVIIKDGEERHNYTGGQNMIVNISPWEVGKHEDTFRAIRIYPREEVYLWNEWAYVNIDSIYCHANCATRNDTATSFHGFLALSLHEKDGTFISYLAKNEVNNKAAVGWKLYWFYFKPSLTPIEKNKEYLLRVVVINQEDEVSDIHLLNGAPNYIYLRTDNSAIYLDSQLPEGISNVLATPDNDDTKYDLNGRTIYKPHPGQIYISNGRKVLHR